MKKIIILVVLASLFIKFKTVSAITDSSYILMDYDSGRVLYENNKDQRFLTASISKIMTAMVAIENGYLFQPYKVSKSSTLVDGSKVYLEEDDEILLYDLICGLMLRSGNDAATLISEVIFSKSNQFVYEMNQTAKRIGMGNTTFQNPTGLNDDTFNYSTAYDMALLMRYAINNEVFYDISTKKVHHLKTLKNSYVWVNKHKLIHRNKGVVSGKTGFTKLCGRTLVSYAVINNKRMICVTFNEGNDYNLHETLFDKANKEFHELTLFKEGVYPQKLSFLNYYPYIKEEVRLLVKENSSVHGKFVFKNIPDETCGLLEIYEDNILVYKTPIYPYWPIS